MNKAEAISRQLQRGYGGTAGAQENARPFRAPEFILGDSVLGSKPNGNRSNASDHAPKQQRTAVELDDIPLAAPVQDRDLARLRPLAVVPAVYKRLFRYSY